jgi:hypothetical protein
MLTLSLTPCHCAADADSDADAILLPMMPPIHYYALLSPIRYAHAAERTRQTTACHFADARHEPPYALPPPPLMPRAPPRC